MKVLFKPFKALFGLLFRPTFSFRLSIKVLVFLCLNSYFCASTQFERQREKQSYLRILPDQKKVSAEAHKTLVLTCQGESQNPEYFTDFRWYDKNGLPIESQTRYQLTNGEGALSLIIEDPIASDGGFYACAALFRKTVTLNASIEIDVYQGITWDDCEPEQYLIYGMHGQKVLCRILSNPTCKVNWEKDEKPLKEDTFAVVSDGILVIGKVANNSAGLFKVKASMLDYGILRTRSIRVKVIVPPRVDHLYSPNELVEGERAIIICEAHTSSPPFYSFFDNRRRNLSLEDGYKVDIRRGILTIESIRKERDQYIECIIENRAGRDAKRLDLKVSSMPEVYEFENRTFSEEMSVTLLCRVRGDPMPKLEIFKMDHSSSLIEANEKPVSGNESRFSFEIIKRSSEEVDYKLIIDRVTRNDAGSYLCKANNTAGVALANAHIQIQYPPDLSDTHTEVRTWGNNSVNLSCIAHAVPNATFFWQFNGRDIRMSGDFYTIREDSAASHLIIRPNVGGYVYGTYSCRALNTRGERSVNINLKQAYPPPSPSISILRTRSTSLDIEIVDVNSDLPVKNYRVKYWQDSMPTEEPKQTVWPTVGKVYKLNGLIPRTRYKLSFAAENDVGISPFTPIKYHETLKESRPERASYVLEKDQEREISRDGFVRSELGTSFKFRWRQADDNGRMIEYYLIKLFKVQKTNDDYIRTSESKKVKPVKVPASSSLEYLLSDLSPNTLYKIELSAVNSIGQSDPIDLVFRTSSDASFSIKSRPEDISTQYNLGSFLSVATALITLLILMDLIFCIRYKVGLLHFLKSFNWSSDSHVTEARSDKFSYSKSHNASKEVEPYLSIPQTKDLAFENTLASTESEVVASCPDDHTV